MDHSNIQEYMKSTRFDYEQREQIERGLESGLDVSIYADPKYSSFQMEEIRNSLLAEREKQKEKPSIRKQLESKECRTSGLLKTKKKEELEMEL